MTELRRHGQLVKTTVWFAALFECFHRIRPFLRFRKQKLRNKIGMAREKRIDRENNEYFWKRCDGDAEYAILNDYIDGAHIVL
jgi:hypothetical protein